MASTATLFKTLVPIANPSGQEGEIRQFILDQLTRWGVTDARVDDAGNLFVRVPGDAGKAPVLLSAHMDSVPPCQGIEPVADRQENREVIRSSGKTILGADDKSGIATMLAIVERIQTRNSQNHRPLELLFSTQEEVGLLGLKAFDLSQCQAREAYVLDGEGSVGDIFYAGPTQKSLVFELSGVRSHAGIAPEAGVSAIEMAAHLCASLPSGRISPETTMNLGVIEGGDALNIVAPNSVIKGEARSHDEKALAALLGQVAEICHEIQDHFPRGTVQFLATHKYSGYSIALDHPAITLAAAACQQLGIAPNTARMNIGSDAHILNHGGIPAVVLGMGFHYSHSLGEFIYVDELEQVTDLVWALVEGP